MSTRARLLERVRVIMAGRAAEEITFGSASTYGVGDLRVRGLSLWLGVACRSARCRAVTLCPLQSMHSIMDAPSKGIPASAIVKRSERQPSVPQDAARLAQNIVAAYGMSSLGITTYAPPPPGGPGFMRKSFEVSVDNIDADLFGRGIRG